MFPALNIIDPELSLLPPALRRVSPMAPNAMEVANPLYCHSLPMREDGIRDSIILYVSSLFIFNGSAFSCKLLV